MTVVLPDVVRTLMDYGWSLRKIHNDGVLDMSGRIDGENVLLFVNKDGRVGIPRTHGTMIAYTNISELGIKLPHAFGAPAPKVGKYKMAADGMSTDEIVEAILDSAERSLGYNDSGEILPTSQDMADGFIQALGAILSSAEKPAHDLLCEYLKKCSDKYKARQGTNA